jgi:predicted nucleic acid-binding protein
MIDTSCFFAAFRDRSPGSFSEADWTRCEEYLAGQVFIDFDADDCGLAARLLVDCRRAGFSPRSTIDCCIAQQAIRHDVTLIHDDNDYEQIARVAPLRQVRVKLQAAKK